LIADEDSGGVRSRNEDEDKDPEVELFDLPTSSS
jgi:hypothetical protein